uniref:Uncharacterized protein n=1 Tax=Plectus sambesii TaxID=2011161 RepID=A0A914V367_9BILA
MTDAKRLSGLIVALLLVDVCRSQMYPQMQGQQMQGYCPYGSQPQINSLNEPVACSGTSS